MTSLSKDKPLEKQQVYIEAAQNGFMVYLKFKASDPGTYTVPYVFECYETMEIWLRTYFE